MMHYPDINTIPASISLRGMINNSNYTKKLPVFSKFNAQIQAGWVKSNASNRLLSKKAHHIVEINKENQSQQKYHSCCLGIFHKLFVGLASCYYFIHKEHNMTAI